MFTSQEIFEEFNNTTRSTEVSNYDHLYYFTEDDDHEIESYIGQPRFGIETIKRKRWGAEQKLHGKVSKFRDRLRKKYLYVHNDIKDLPEDPDPFRYELHETSRDCLDLEGYPVKAQKVTHDGDRAWLTVGGWTIYTDRASTVYTDHFLALERIAMELKSFTTEQKFRWVKENEADLKKFFSVFAH